VFGETARAIVQPGFARMWSCDGALREQPISPPCRPGAGAASDDPDRRTIREAVTRIENGSRSREAGTEGRERVDCMPLAAARRRKPC